MVMTIFVGWAVAGIVLYPLPVINNTAAANLSSHTVKDVNIAIFKVTSAIKALERRIERLGKQAGKAHVKVL